MATAGSGSESTVRTALAGFLKEHKLHDNVGDIDEIVLSYVISILEDLGDSQNADENIDVDQFVEMMEAYIPGFASIDSVRVCEWMFELASRLSKSQGDSVSKEEHSPPSLKSDLIQTVCMTERQQSRDIDSTGESERSTSESSTDEFDEQIQTLTEMFPDTLRIEIEHCLHGSEWELDRAVQLILHRQEANIAFTEENRPKTKKTSRFNPLEDKQERQRIISRYGHIDVAEDKRTFKPSVPTEGPKKMVRYLDNQIVNTKGQKFTEIKREETDEMKKTYVNLKPARKYRFH